MEKIPVGDGGFVYAVDQKGHIVASPEYLPQGEIVNFETNPAVKEAISGGMGITELYSPEKETYFLIAYQPVEHNWGILVQQPKDTAFSERNLVRKVVISIFFAVIIINIVRITVLKRIIKSCP
jgi:hypothetical protein